MLSKSNLPSSEAMKAASKVSKADAIEVFGKSHEGTFVESVYRDEHLQFLVFAPDGSHSYEAGYTHGNQVFTPPISDLNAISRRFICLPNGLGVASSSDELLSRIRVEVGGAIDLPPFELDLISNFILMTWCWEAWDASTYMHFLGEPNTGKTRCLEVMKELCFRGTDLGVNVSRGALLRTVDRVRGTCIIDEADYDADMRSELIKLLNAGYRRGGVMPLCVSRNNADHQTNFYGVGGPKVFATRHEFNDAALESRCIAIHTVSKQIAKHIPTRLSKRFFEAPARLREDLLAWRIPNLPIFAEDETEVEGLEGRARQICLPLLKASPDENFRKQLLKFMDHQAKQLSLENPLRIALEALKQTYEDLGKPTLELEQIRFEAQKIALKPYLFGNKKLANLLRSLTFATSKWGIGTVVMVDQKTLEEQCSRFQVGSEDGDGGDCAVV